MLTHVGFFYTHKSASRLRLKQNRGCLNAAAEESTGQRCSISSGAINHRYAHEKSHLFKHDSIRTRGRVSFSSSGKHHRIINEKFKNYFWSFPTRLENLKPNLRDAFSQPEKRKKKKKKPPKCKLSKRSHGSEPIQKCRKRFTFYASVYVVNPSGASHKHSGTKPAFLFSAPHAA